tara:strand:- start:152 stop:520 length:369 start_codon:yes stop_codon:yes gene_type:complete
MCKDERRTMSFVARKFGLTRQRVQQLLKRMDEFGYGKNRFIVPAVFIKDMILPPRLHNFFKRHNVSDKTIKQFVAENGVYWMYLKGGLGIRFYQYFIEAIKNNGYVDEAKLLENEIRGLNEK